MCIVVWLDDVLNIPRWHLGYVSQMDGQKYIVEHLVREKSSNDNFWKNPSNIQTFSVDEEQFLVVKVNGDWEVEKVSGNRISMQYHLKNSLISS